MSNLFGEWTKQIKNKLAYSGAALILVTTSLGSGLPLLATQRVSADTGCAAPAPSTTIVATSDDLPTLSAPHDMNVRDENLHGFYFAWDAPSNDQDSPYTYDWESSTANTINTDGSFISPVCYHGDLTGTSIFDSYSPANTYFWHVRSINNNGVKSAWTTPWEVIINPDTPAAPSAPLSASITTDAANQDSNGQAYIGLGDTVTFSADLQGPITDYDFTVTDAANHIVSGPFTNPSDGSLQLSSATLPDGDYTVHLDAWDAAGNYVSDTKDVVIDTAAPIATLTNPVDNQIISGSITATGSVTDTNLDSYTLYICRTSLDDDGSVVSQPLDSCWQRSRHHADQSFQILVDTTKKHFKDGTYNFVLKATDKANNQTVTVTPVTIINAANTGGTSTGTGSSTNTGSGNPVSSTNSVVTPQILTAATITAARSNATSPTPSAVLGTSTETSNDNLPTTPVTHANTKLADHKNVCSKWFGACWYWTVAVVLVFIGALYSYVRVAGRGKTATGK